VLSVYGPIARSQSCLPLSEFHFLKRAIDHFPTYRALVICSQQNGTDLPYAQRSTLGE
jgi:hypothetical protein